MEKKKRKLALLEKEYQDLLERYIEALLKREKANYHSELEPFEAHAEKLKKEMTAKFLQFHNQFLQGWAVIMSQLRKK